MRRLVRRKRKARRQMETEKKVRVRRTRRMVMLK